METVSVIIPCYNIGDRIERGVRSLQAQTHPCHEIIIVDDGSSDGSPEIAKRLAAEDPRIKLIVMPQNGGVSRARNAGFRAATGDWLAILDGDDTWRPERNAALLARAREYGADYVMDNMIIHDVVAGRDTRKMIAPSWDVLPLPQVTFWQHCIFGTAMFAIMKMMVRRSFMERTGHAYDEDTKNAQDLIFHADALALGAKAIVVAEPYYVYSARIGDVSHKRNKSSRTKMDFALLTTRIDAFARRRADAIDPATARAIARSRESFKVAARLNTIYRARRENVAKALVLLARDPAALKMMLRQRYRAFITSRPPYTL